MKKLSGDQEPFMNLPSEIIINILSRLSTKTINQCLSVSKAWFKLLSSPEFADLRFLRSPPYLVIHKNWSNFNLVELEDEPNYHDFYYLRGTNTDYPKGFPQNSMAMFGSIDGLICLYQFGFPCPDIVLWNATMGEYITIKSPGGIMEYPNVVSYGFGLSSGAGHYKVVRIFQEQEKVDNSWKIRKSDCHVYTLGEGSWRKTGHAPFLYSVRTHGIFLNDYLHWLIRDPDGPELISCFDLEKEKFQPFPAPPELSQDNLASLEVYKDCLSVCDNSSDFELVI